MSLTTDTAGADNSTPQGIDVTAFAQQLSTTGVAGPKEALAPLTQARAEALDHGVDLHLVWLDHPARDVADVRDLAKALDAQDNSDATVVVLDGEHIEASSATLPRYRQEAAAQDALLHATMVPGNPEASIPSSVEIFRGHAAGPGIQWTPIVLVVLLVVIAAVGVAAAALRRRAKSLPAAVRHT